MTNLELKLDQEKPYKIDYNSYQWINLPKDKKELIERKVNFLNKLNEDSNKIGKYAATAGAISSTVLACLFLDRNMNNFNYIITTCFSPVIGGFAGLFTSIPIEMAYRSIKINNFLKQEEKIKLNQERDYTKNINKNEYLKS